MEQVEIDRQIRSHYLRWDYICLIHSCQYECEYIEFSNKYTKYTLKKTKELIEIEFQ